MTKLGFLAILVNVGWTTWNVFYIRKAVEKIAEGVKKTDA